MNLNFDLEKITVTEFGVGLDDGDGGTFVVMPVDSAVQAALREMVETTWKSMSDRGGSPAKYEPSEKHAAIEYLYLPLNDDLAETLRQLHQASNLPSDGDALDDPARVFCYFARLVDKKGRRLTALRRASQFKGVLKNRLLRLVSDSLKLIEDRVFKLDHDFDLLLDSANVLILRPSAFEFAGKLQDAVLGAVPENVAEISKNLQYVDLASIEEYASKHPRAARYLASIRSQWDTKNIDKSALKKLCKNTGVDLVETKGTLAIQPGQEMAFLEVLDRRRYELDLVKGSPERFKASSRSKLGG